jgi:uncharacterized protein (TIGR00266 family)
MQIEVEHRPAYALAVVKLQPNEVVVAEGGAMVSMDTNITISTSAGKKDQGMLGSLFSGLKRMVAGESFFQNQYTANGGPATITFAPTHVGDVEVHQLIGQVGMLLQSHAYLCSGPDVTVDAKWTGARSFFAGEGLVMLKATGSGPIAFNAFGAIKAIDITGDFVVDTGHIVAFEDTLKYTVNRFGGGWKSFIFGGEGMVCNFTGTGRMWLQTRNPVAFGQAMGPKLPMREN